MILKTNVAYGPLVAQGIGDRIFGHVRRVHEGSIAADTKGSDRQDALL